MVVARQSIAASGNTVEALSGTDSRAGQLATLGIALVLSKQFEEGVTVLEQALARGGNRFDQSMRAFYLGAPP